MNIIRPKFSFLTIFAILALLFIVYQHQTILHQEKKSHKKTCIVKPKLKKKQILVYTKLFGQKPWWQIPYNYDFNHYNGKPCEERFCRITYDRNQLNDSDAVLFHALDIDKKPAEMKKLRRDQNQQWIWLMHESPTNPQGSSINWAKWDDTFNLTVTYRPSSDVYMPYFHILGYDSKEDIRRPKQGTNFAAGKKYKCLFVNSHCDAFRMDLIRNLKKHITADVYGRCRTIINPELKRTCPRSSPQCLQLQKEYKFYLAFENTLCDDYVTEKYYQHGLMNGLVPIVLNAADMKNRGVAIPKSYINLLDFKDMKSLAEYLNYLDKNDTAYNEYHAWRYQYRVNEELNFMCGVCKTLWQNEQKCKPTSTVNLTQFWGKDTCKPTSHPMFKKYLP